MKRKNIIFKANFQDLEKYAGPDAVREWQKLLVSINIHHSQYWMFPFKATESCFLYH